MTVTILALHFCIRALLRECLRDAAADSGFIGHQTIIGHQTTITVRCCNHCATAAPKCFFILMTIVNKIMRVLSVCMCANESSKMAEHAAMPDILKVHTVA